MEASGLPFPTLMSSPAAAPASSSLSSFATPVKALGGGLGLGLHSQQQHLPQSATPTTIRGPKSLSERLQDGVREAWSDREHGRPVCLYMFSKLAIALLQLLVGLLTRDIGTYAGLRACVCVCWRCMWLLGRSVGRVNRRRVRVCVCVVDVCTCLALCRTLLVFLLVIPTATIRDDCVELPHDL